MTNIDKAIAVLNEVDEYQDHLPDNAAYVHALHGKGLLMPDLPEHEDEAIGNRYWYSGSFTVGSSDLLEGRALVWFWDSEPGGGTYADIDTARAYAYKILAACDHAGRGTGDE